MKENIDKIGTIVAGVLSLILASVQFYLLYTIVHDFYKGLSPTYTMLLFIILTFILYILLGICLLMRKKLSNLGILFLGQVSGIYILTPQKNILLIILIILNFIIFILIIISINQFNQPLINRPPIPVTYTELLEINWMGKDTNHWYTCLWLFLMFIGIGTLYNAIMFYLWVAIYFLIFILLFRHRCIITNQGIILNKHQIITWENVHSYKFYHEMIYLSVSQKITFLNLISIKRHKVSFPVLDKKAQIIQILRMYNVFPETSN